MKAVLPLALVGALAVGTAYAASGSSSSMNTGDSQSGGSATMSHQTWNQDQVKQIQGKLKQQGYDVGQVDGKLGPNTQQALRQFQEDKGIQASGQPDQQTLAALNTNPSGTQQGQMPSNSGRSGSSSGSTGSTSSTGSTGNMGTGGSTSGGMSGGSSSGGQTNPSGGGTH